MVAAVIRWPSSLRRRSDAAVSVQLLSSSWPGRLALLAVALGLVLMHHVVGTHQHSAPDVAPAGASAHSLIDLKAVSPSGHHDTVGGPTPQASSAVGPPVAHGPPAGLSDTGTAALLHHHPDEDGHGHGGALLHMCLAALVGAAVLLLALVLVASRGRFPPRLAAQGLATRSTLPRDPPTSSRLAELQILRL